MKTEPGLGQRSIEDFLFADWSQAMDFAKRYNATPVLEDGWWIVRPPSRRQAPRPNRLATWYRRHEMMICLAVLVVWVVTMLAVLGAAACGR